MFNINYIYITGAVTVIALGQIMFKCAAQQLQIDSGQTYEQLLRDNIYPLALVLLACMLYLVSTVAWVQALRTVPLSIAFLFNSLAFVLVPAAGFLLFGEQMPKYFFPGLLMIIGGILLVSRG